MYLQQRNDEFTETAIEEKINTEYYNLLSVSSLLALRLLFHRITNDFCG